ncbi:hypothetical protein GCM10009528_03120 [Kineococcus aurantiacus]
MQVDQARQGEQARAVDDGGALGGQAGADLGDDAVAQQQVGGLTAQRSDVLDEGGVHASPPGSSPASNR